MSYRETRRDPNTNSTAEYTYDEFIQHYGPQEGRAVWERAGSSQRYYEGQRIRAISRLLGDKGQVVNYGDFGVVTRVPNASNRHMFEKGAVAEVKIGQITFDAKPDMIEPADRPRSAPRGGPAPRPRSQPSGRGMERRPDTDGRMYSYEEFIQYYGRQEGANRWRKAGQERGGSAPRGVPRRQPEKPAKEERRADPNETSGKKYTKREFVELYGKKKADRLWKKAAPKQEKRPDPTEKSGKQYTIEEFVKFYGEKEGKKMWNKAGASSGSGAVEKRRDPTDPKSKKTFTKEEFIQFYGKKEGTKHWNAAAPAGGAAAASGKEEKRADPNENTGKKYTKKQFIDLYGKKKGEKVWKQAAPKEEEKRADPSENTGKLYTQKEFIDLYGKKKGAKIWAEAGEKRADPNEKNSKQKFTRAEFLAHYGAKKGAKVWTQAAKQSEKKTFPKPDPSELYEEVKYTVKKDDKGEIGWTRKGLSIVKVIKESPAEAAGIKKRSRIVAIGDKKPTPKDIEEILTEAGNEFEVTLNVPKQLEKRPDPNEKHAVLYAKWQFKHLYGDKCDEMWEKAVQKAEELKEAAAKRAAEREEKKKAREEKLAKEKEEKEKEKEKEPKEEKTA